MKLGSFTPVAAFLAALIASACGSAGTDTLFGSNRPSNAGTGGTGFTPNYSGGFSGQPFPQGTGAIGTFGTGGSAGANGNGGNPNGGFGGVGGVPPANSGGGPNGLGGNAGAGTGGLDAGSPAQGDAGFNPLGCDFSGTWASYVAIDVTWPLTIVLLQGQGKLQQWNLTREVQAPLSTTITAHTKPCGIFLPDLQTTIFNFFQKYGIRFPDTLFDKGTIPETTFNFVADITSNPITFKTDPFAIVIGTNLTDAVTAPWPAASAMNLRDDDHDNNPGITVIPVTSGGYSLPPTDLFSGNTADLVYIATRTVSMLTGTITSCDKIEADVTIQTVNGKPGIDSTVVGCERVPANGQSKGPCTSGEASFVDGARPQFTPAGTGHMTIVRVPDSTTCADVRTRFPLQQ